MQKCRLGYLVICMEKKKSLLTESADSCGWLAVGLSASIFVIFLTGVSEQYPTFYSSVVIQILNFFPMYLGVTRKNHEKFISIVAGVVRIVIFAIAFFCIAFFYLLANKPVEGVYAYKIYEFLQTSIAVIIVTVLSLIPFVECIIEYFIHIILTPTD